MPTELTDHHDKKLFEAYIGGFHCGVNGVPFLPSPGMTPAQRRMADIGKAFGVTSRERAIKMAVELCYVGPDLKVLEDDSPETTQSR